MQGHLADQPTLISKFILLSGRFFRVTHFFKVFWKWLTWARSSTNHGKHIKWAHFGFRERRRNVHRSLPLSKIIYRKRRGPRLTAPAMVVSTLKRWQSLPCLLACKMSRRSAARDRYDQLCGFGVFRHASRPFEASAVDCTQFSKLGEDNRYSFPGTKSASFLTGKWSGAFKASNYARHVFFSPCYA